VGYFLNLEPYGYFAGGPEDTLDIARPAKVEMVMEKDVRKGILKLAHDMDLVLMGGRTGDFLGLLLGKSLSQEITEQVKCPVLWVKEYEEIESFWTLLFKKSPEVEKRDENI
jgi:hypothetical protein